jgi:hypothetical protein
MSIQPKNEFVCPKRCIFVPRRTKSLILRIERYLSKKEKFWCRERKCQRTWISKFDPPLITFGTFLNFIYCLQKWKNNTYSQGYCGQG